MKQHSGDVGNGPRQKSLVVGGDGDKNDSSECTDTVGKEGPFPVCSAVFRIS